MKKGLVRGLLTTALTVSFAVGLFAALTPALASHSCEHQCYQDYRRCVPFCAKNPCFVSCETVLEICLSNCGLES